MADRRLPRIHRGRGSVVAKNEKLKNALQARLVKRRYVNAKRNAKILQLSASMTYGEIAKKLHISRHTVAGVILRAKPGARDRNNEYQRRRYRDFPHVRESEHQSSQRWCRKHRAKILKKKRAQRARIRLTIRQRTRVLPLNWPEVP